MAEDFKLSVGNVFLIVMGVCVFFLVIGIICAIRTDIKEALARKREEREAARRCQEIINQEQIVPPASDDTGLTN